MNGDEDDLVTAAAIARRAGVGRAAVSNWRKRYPDEFPRPRGGLFSWGEVLQWLTTTGKAGQLAVAGRTDTGTRRIDDVAASVIGGHPVVPQDRGLGSLSADELLARTMVALLPFPEDATSPDLGDGADAVLPVLLDPGCADGALLVAMADRFGDHVQLVGHETDEADAREAATRLRGHPLDPVYAVHTEEPERGDRLAPYAGTAAAVLCRGPMQARPVPVPDPRRGTALGIGADHEPDWITTCLSLLRPRGTAVVAVPATFATRSSDRELRTALVRSGTLRMVIALPAGFGGRGAALAHLWVLQRPPVDDAPVRMVDLYGRSDPADLPVAREEWECLVADAGPTTARAVPRLELLDGDTALLPSRHVSPTELAEEGELAGIVDRLRAGYARIGGAFPVLGDAPSLRDRPPVTLAELERAGALRIRARDTTPRAGDVLLRILARPPIVATGTADDELGVAHVVEIDGDRLDPHFVALFLRPDVAAVPITNTHGAISRDDLRRCRIPRMSLDEQRRYGATFQHVTDLREVLGALHRLSGTVLDQTLHGLTTGALLPSPIPARENIAGDPNESETP